MSKLLVDLFPAAAEPYGALTTAQLVAAVVQQQSFGDSPLPRLTPDDIKRDIKAAADRSNVVRIRAQICPCRVILSESHHGFLNPIYDSARDSLRMGDFERIVAELYRAWALGTGRADYDVYCTPDHAKHYRAIKKHHSEQRTAVVTRTSVGQTLKKRARDAQRSIADLDWRLVAFPQCTNHPTISASYVDEESTRVGVIVDPAWHWSGEDAVADFLRRASRLPSATYPRIQIWVPQRT